MAKLIVYDLDGTLIDSAKIVTSVLNQMRTERGLEHLEAEQLVPWLSMGGEDLVANALGLPVKGIQSHLTDFRKRYSEIDTPNDSIYPGIKETLNHFVNSGFQLAVCTNKPRVLAEKVLKETQLYDYFGYMNAGGDLPYKKPHPQTLLSCLEFFGVDSREAILVGDSTVDQSLAQATDVAFVQYLPGYDDGIELFNPQMKINHHRDLKNLIPSLGNVINS
ncbi:HAD-IA family hydrolase [Polynucleobacter sp. JS-Safj-400b-B2]|uniref:HAD-IA family hydrolase n=1 Tax=Polynucleobacter sp. JS-Safj-400b-B2 TaxID=2576921 RepID=UPI001C0E4971|nr:HAD-IA family hydrolase [Polynucleobacter sp. JS-Safj-400b-B2]MBU3625039.1 HAD-IA family hydrolase [Polynucleobacter sp. JS-Safj-400b-B2]